MESRNGIAEEIKARKKQAVEKEGFLRIGSLNVRVKRTTEAFSNFLGVGNADKLHKNWGSADNIPEGDSKKMPPPKFAPIKKRKSKRGADYAANRCSAPENPTPTEPILNQNSHDSDPDLPSGLGAWQSAV